MALAAKLSGWKGWIGNEAQKAKIVPHTEWYVGRGSAALIC